MELILNNPFRILGLPITATARQITKRVDDLSMFCEMGKTKTYDTDFPFLSPINRTIESIHLAASQIELPGSKLFHSIFWFWQGNSVDELVFDLMSRGHTTKAKALWEKTFVNNSVSKKNISNIRNLSLLKIASSIDSGQVNHVLFIKAIKMFLNTFNQECFSDYISSIGGVSCNSSVVDLQKQFSDETYKVIGLVASENKNVADRNFILAFNGTNDEVFQYVRDKVISTPISLLESSIKTCQESRKSSGESIYDAAECLNTTATDLLNNLQKILTNKDMHFKSIADKVAEELLICSTEHYNVIYESDDTSLPLDQAENITQWAKFFAVTANTKAKIEDDLECIQRIRSDNIFEAAMAEVGALFTKIPNPGESTSSSIQRIPSKLIEFISKSKKPLAVIESADPNEYLKLSDIMVNLVLSLCIEYANKTADYESVVGIVSSVRSFRMLPFTKMRFSENLLILTRNHSSKSAQISKSNNDGCYIATLVYGSYESPEVLVLRNFRDEVLATSLFGRSFIRIYYAVSPSLVSLLINQDAIQNVIRTLLNRFVQWIKK